MASRGVSVLKFVGTVSLGLLTVSPAAAFPLGLNRAGAVDGDVEGYGT
jgi:hypothetical protein